jgi:hypothetical protein
MRIFLNYGLYEGKNNMIDSHVSIIERSCVLIVKKENFFIKMLKFIYV